MKRSKKQIPTLLAALALSLALLAACGGTGAQEKTGNSDPGENASSLQQEEAPADAQPEEEAQQTEPASGENGEDISAPAGPAESDLQDSGAGGQGEQPQQEEEQQTEPGTSAPEAEPDTEDETMEPSGETEPELAEDVPEDGNYTASVTLEGGSGRASVGSPAQLRCEDGQFWAVIVWSSPNYDYMKVDGVKYEPTNTEGNSTFEIPVAAFDRKLEVIADTVAMSEPHEVEYTLYFDAATLQKQ